MYAELRSPNVHEPQNLAEYTNTIMSYKDNITYLWAGGTYIMSQPGFYPSASANVEIISLGKIEELKHFLRNDRFAEFGSMVSLSRIQSVGALLLPKILIAALETTATHLVRDQITIGGCLCTPSFRTSIASVLMLLDSNAEIKYPKKRIHTKWFPMSRVYDKNGKLSLPQNALMTKIRIPIQQFDYQYFRTVGSPLTDASSSVSLAAVAKMEQNSISSGKLIITFPDKGFCQSRDIDNIFSSLQFPCDDAHISSFYSYIITYIRENLGDVSQLQEVRLRGMLSNLIDELNQKSISPL
ncbi:MAG: FAD binding domain-containing protein [Bullifex sp.]